MRARPARPWWRASSSWFRPNATSRQRTWQHTTRPMLRPMTNGKTVSMKESRTLTRNTTSQRLRQRAKGLQLEKEYTIIFYVLFFKTYLFDSLRHLRPLRVMQVTTILTNKTMPVATRAMASSSGNLYQKERGETAHQGIVPFRMCFLSACPLC